VCASVARGVGDLGRNGPVRRWDRRSLLPGTLAFQGVCRKHRPWCRGDLRSPAGFTVGAFRNSRESPLSVATFVRIPCRHGKEATANHEQGDTMLPSRQHRSLERLERTHTTPTTCRSRWSACLRLPHQTTRPTMSGLAISEKMQAQSGRPHQWPCALTSFCVQTAEGAIGSGADHDDRLRNAGCAGLGPTGPRALTSTSSSSSSSQKSTTSPATRQTASAVDGPWRPRRLLARVLATWLLSRRRRNRVDDRYNSRYRDRRGNGRGREPAGTAYTFAYEQHHKVLTGRRATCPLVATPPRMLHSHRYCRERSAIFTFANLGISIG